MFLLEMQIDFFDQKEKFPLMESFSTQTARKI